MKAITLDAPGEFRAISLEEPDSPGPGQALVATHRLGICGTDYAGYLGKAAFWKYPNIIGHELGVEVLATGPDVTAVKPGDRCAVEPYLNCGQCYACRKGATNCCDQLEVLGIMTEGGLRERFLIRADKLHSSSQLTYEQLSLVETLGIGSHATERGAPQSGDHVLIIGAGPIGLSVLEFTRLTGATITVMDRVESRLEFCRSQYGVAHTILVEEDGQVEETVLKITDGDRYAVVFDVTGSPTSMSQALHFVAQTGTLVYVGVTTREISFTHPTLHRRDMTLKASRNSLPSDFRKIIQCIENGTIDTAPWITHRTPFAELIGAFDSFTKPESGVIKAVVELT